MDTLLIDIGLAAAVFTVVCGVLALVLLITCYGAFTRKGN